MAFEFDDDDDDRGRGRGRDRGGRSASRSAGRSGASPIGDFLTFRSMVTPVLIQMVFWIGVIGCLIIGGWAAIAGLDLGGQAGRKELSPPLIAGGFMFALAGPLFVRVYCELLIIFFKIHDELKEANDRERR